MYRFQPNVTAVSPLGFTALHIAAVSGSVGVMPLLLEHASMEAAGGGASSLQIKDVFGRTATDIACMHVWAADVAAALNTSVAQMCSGANVGGAVTHYRHSTGYV